jgi:hypothetical protein
MMLHDETTRSGGRVPHAEFDREKSTFDADIEPANVVRDPLRSAILRAHEAPGLIEPVQHSVHQSHWAVFGK